jgi:hypothetical protein
MEAKPLAVWKSQFPDRIMAIHNADEVEETFSSPFPLDHCLFGPSIDPERPDMVEDKEILFDHVWIPIRVLSKEDLVELSQNCDEASIEKVGRINYLKLWWD